MPAARAYWLPRLDGYLWGSVDPLTTAFLLFSRGENYLVLCVRVDS